MGMWKIFFLAALVETFCHSYSRICNNDVSQFILGSSWLSSNLITKYIGIDFIIKQDLCCTSDPFTTTYTFTLCSTLNQFHPSFVVFFYFFSNGFYFPCLFKGITDRFLSSGSVRISQVFLVFSFLGMSQSKSYILGFNVIPNNKFLYHLITKASPFDARWI